MRHLCSELELLLIDMPKPDFSRDEQAEYLYWDLYDLLYHIQKAIEGYEPPKEPRPTMRQKYQETLAQMRKEREHTS